MIVECLKCNGKMVKIYSNEKVEEIVNESKITNPLLIMQYRFELLNQFVCEDCKHAQTLSKSDIIKTFVTGRREDGKSMKDIIKEVSEVKTEGMDKFKEIDKEPVKLNIDLLEKGDEK